MKILSLNCQAYSTAKKDIKLLTENYEIDILCLTETWEHPDEKLKFKNWNIQSRPRNVNSHGGVAILTKQSEHFIIERKADLEKDDVEVMCALVKMQKGEDFLLVVSYVPPSKHGELKSLIDMIENLSKTFKNIIVTGDLNAKSKVWGNRVVNYAGELLEEYMWKSNYVCVNDGLPTRRNSDSVIDLMIITPSLVRQVLCCETLHHENVRSDHIAVLLEIEDGLPEKNREICEKIVLEKTNWLLWDEITKEKFAEWNYSESSSNNIDVLFTTFLDKFNQCVTECIPKVSYQPEHRRVVAPWVNDEVRLAKTELNGMKKHFKRRRTEQILQKLKDKEVAYNTACEKAKSEWVNKSCDIIDKCTDPKKKWLTFHQLTSYRRSEGNNVLPLLNMDGKPVFEKHGKCEILKQTFFGGDHIVNEKFDEDFRASVEDKLKLIKSTSSNDDEKFLNRKISRIEVVAALQKLQNGKAPGPDNILPDLLKVANDTFIDAITTLFQKSFSCGKLPKSWKTANVKFLQKPGKESYYKAGSYRPISLTSVLGKCMERIINARLYSFAEHFKLLDREQDGFRERRGTTQALLRIVQDISMGMHENNITAAVFIDMEKAFDTVWRDGLLVKLHNMGIKGQVWTWLEDFLTEREAICCLRSYRGEPATTYMGLPQGSVLSPLLFNLFLSDIFNNVDSEKVKFADDGTIWRTDQDSKRLETCLQRDINCVVEWTKKWRMKLNTDKTEMCTFRKTSDDIQQIDLFIRGEKIHQVKQTKVLGVILDEKLNFIEHLNYIEAKAAKALGTLMCVAKAEKISPTNMIKLYRSFVIPHLEYAAPVWQTSNAVHILEKVQRKGLRLCMGSLATTSVDGLEVQANILPLDLRREEISIRECSKIMAKEDSSLIKQSLNRCRESNQFNKTPLSKMLQQVSDMESLTEIDLKCIEPEFTYLEGLQPSRRKPAYWNNLGSSKTRTKQQETDAKEVIRQMLLEEDASTSLAFTDGSCKGNPGPCGAGSCLYMPNRDRIDLKQPVSKLASILVGELVAIKITLQYIFDESKRRPVQRLKLLSDSQTAIGMLQLGWNCKQHIQLVQDIKALWSEVEKVGCIVNLDWTPGHASIEGNEIADRLAKEAAAEAETIGGEFTEPTSQADVCIAANDAVKIKWQRRWETTDKARRLYELKPKIGSKTLDFSNYVNQTTLLQLQSGHNKLKHHLHRIGVEDTPACECGEPETEEHFLLHCEQYSRAREELMRNLYNMIGLRQTEVTVQLLLTSACSAPDDPWNEFRQTIANELSMFVMASGRFSGQQ